MKVALGGQRLGSGNKREQELHNYYRSTFNLNESFKSSLAPGILYPCYVNVGTNGDVFEIDMDTLARTIPTRGPLFGTYKLQIDVFSIPIRLYQGVLHNNAINIGLNMNQVKLPRLKIWTKKGADKIYPYADKYTSQISSSALMKYLGLSGIGWNVNNDGDSPVYTTRYINAVPMLAYYDIFKNYYANKQENMAYVISQDNSYISPTGSIFQSGIEKDIDRDSYVSRQISAELSETHTKALHVEYTATGKYPTISIMWGTKISDPSEPVIKLLAEGDGYRTLEYLKKSGALYNYSYHTAGDNPDTDFQYKVVSLELVMEGTVALDIAFIKSSNIELLPFELENIDTMREELLTESQLGRNIIIPNDIGNYLPYSCNSDLDLNGFSKNVHPLNGLCVKTYQSDIFNNWLKTEWIDGENGINAITAVSTAGDSFTIDALNLANKVYNMLNRVAISGGTYQDWQEAVYTQKAVQNAETPMYEGGMSSEIVFDEVISTASGEYEGDTQALGTLGGRGKQMGRKGGRMNIKLKEPAFIMAIVSITPRITQSQGNMWYLTELTSIDDFHKPALDGIGFQNLIAEQMGWWDTQIDGDRLIRHSVGKVPAWINYMTSFDKCYGDFGNSEGKSFMVLNRNYEMAIDDDQNYIIKDVTTYIDPKKFNYVFAYTELDAQNFWVQIDFKVKARRLMSAKQIPNL